MKLATYIRIPFCCGKCSHWKHHSKTIKGKQEFLEKVCIQGERPPIPSHWSKPLQQMLQSAWHDDYKQRPDIATIRSVLREELLRGCDSADGRVGQ